MGKRVATGIEKLGRQKYRLWWTDPRTHKESSTVFSGSLTEAIAARSEIVTSIKAKTYVTPSKVTLGECIDEHLRAMKLKQDVAPSTHRRYSTLLSGTLKDHLGPIPIQDLEARDIDAYYLWALEHERTRLKDAKGEQRLVSPATVAKRHQALKMVLADAVRRRDLRHNPAADASPPKRHRPEAIAFTLPEAHVVLDECEAVMSPVDALAVRVALFTGMRIGEVLGLRTADCGASSVTIAGKILEMSEQLKWEPYAKTHHSRRTITIDEDLGRALKDRTRDQAAMKMKHGKAWQRPELVFTTPTGGIMRPNTLSGHFTDIVRPMEADGTLTTTGATFHTLRHTHATALLRNRVPLSVVSKRLGHKDEVITLLYYSHVMPGDDESAASTFVDAWAEAEAANVEKMSNAADA